MLVRTKLQRFLPLSALLLLVAFSVAGCSSKEASASAAETVRQAGQNTGDADSVSFEMSVQLSGVMGADLAIDAEGQSDLQAGRSRMSMDAAGQQVDAVLDGTVVYFKMPFLGDDWLRTDLATETPVSGALGAGAEDPTKILAWLQAAGSDVTKVGSEQVRGEDAEHYRATLNLREAAAQLDGDTREQVEQALELFGQDEFPLDLWLNDDGLPVKLTYQMSFGGSSEQLLKDASVNYTIEYFDWGKPVQVEVPNPADVKELGDLEGLMSLVGWD